MRVHHAVLLVSVVAASAEAQRPTRREGPPISAAVSDLRYEVTFNRATASTRRIRVVTRLSLAPGAREPVLLSLPAWTPGAYELSWFARNAHGFAATAEGKPLRWDKLDADTWRIVPDGARNVTVSFDFRADSLDNAMAWSADDFAFFNGTNLLLYPEGRDLAFGAAVTVKTESDWKVTTGMSGGGSQGEFRFSAPNYHDLVDMPFFVGSFDLDSAQVERKWVRLATYPAGKLSGDARTAFWGDLRRMFRPMIDVFGEAPYDTYTNLLVFDENSAGGSALEHANSHLGIYTPFAIGNPLLASITAHEIFHAWNVKRMRPAEMWPYRYDVAQPTTLLWVSEGLTDYYADLSLVRGGVIDSVAFLGVTGGKMDEVAQAPPVALEDASLGTWMHPTDGTGYLYYPKGSLAGFLLDIQIRDASDNTSSLDDVMRDVYSRSYKQGKGFTTGDWWAAVSRAAKGKSFDEFNARYIDGREPFPYSQVLALAGMRIRVDSLREPRLGVFTEMDSSGVRVTATDSGSAAALAGIKPGDYLLTIGAIPVTEGFGERFRARYGRSDRQTIPVKIRRQGEEMTLDLVVRMELRTEQHLTFDRAATGKAARIRHGILTGRR